LKGIRPRLAPYAVALLAVGSASLLTFLLYSQLFPTIFPLFFAAVAISAWYGGIESGLLATFISTLAINYFFMEPVFSHSVATTDDIIRLSVFLLVTILISLLNTELRRAKQQLETSMQKLQASETRFTKLVQSNILGVIIADINGAIIEANDAFLSMVGYSQEDVLAGRVRWRDMTPAEYIEISESCITDLRTKGVCQPFEKEYICKDGSRVPALVGSTLLENNQQQVISFVLDLTNRKRTEQALRRREDEMRLITNAVPVLISYVDAQQCYRFNNKGYEDWFGFSAADIYGKHIQEVLGESVYQALIPYIEAVFSGQQVTFENQIFRKDGSSHIVSTTYVPQFGTQGQVEGFVALVTDITTQKLAEKALKDSEERLRTLTEKVRVIPWEADVTTGKFTYVGPQTVEILGYSLQEWYTDNFWEEHIHPEDREWATKYCYERDA
jgi:PAS domain S-box-containing protein